LNENNMQQMMQRAQEMQSRMSDLQNELSARRFEAGSGGGMVQVAVSGALRVLSIEIESSLVNGGDQAMLQDLIAAGVNAALAKAQDSVQKEIAQLQQTMLTGLAG